MEIFDIITNTINSKIKVYKYYIIHDDIFIKLKDSFLVVFVY